MNTIQPTLERFAVLGVVGVTVADGRITAIDLVVNPDELAGFKQQWEAGAYH